MAVLFFACLGRFYISLHWGFDSSRYLSFDHYSARVLTMSLYPALISLFELVFHGFNGIKALARRVVGILTLEVVGYSIASSDLTHSVDNKLTAGIFAASLLLTYTLLGVMFYYRVGSRRTIQIVSSLGAYFSVIAICTVLLHFFPAMAVRLGYLDIVTGILLLASWTYAFLRTPERLPVYIDARSANRPLYPATAETPRISKPPGALLMLVADFLCSTRTVERVVRPIVSDMRFEYWEALHAGRRGKAVWICLRGYWSFFKALGLYSIVKAAFEIWQKLRFP
jgi:hypothetical protein